MNALYTFDEVSKMIIDGRTLVLGGVDDLLKKLPKGNWIGGTAACFLDKNGGEESEEKLFAFDFTDIAIDVTIKGYKADQLMKITEDEYENGFVYLLLPVFSEVLGTYGMAAFDMPNLCKNPIFGWVAGMKKLDSRLKAGAIHGAVFNGKTGEMDANLAMAMHCKLPDTKIARIEIVTPFSEGEGDVFTFKEKSFQFSEFYVNGKLTNAVEYFTQEGIDPRKPLFTNVYGANICVVLGLADLDKDDKCVTAAVPLNPDQEYRFAKMNENYVQEFHDSMPTNTNNICASTSCYVNYMLLGLKGKNLGNLRGLFTFGEIGYTLLNQTTVNLYIDEVK